MIIIIALIITLLEQFEDSVDKLDQFLSNRAMEARFDSWEHATTDPKYGSDNAEETKNGLEELKHQKSNCEAVEGQFEFSSDGSWKCHVLGVDGGIATFEGQIDVNYQKSQ